jgi:aminopeptidase N
VSSAFQPSIPLGYTGNLVNWTALFLFLFLGGLGCALAQDQDTQGISRQLARARAGRVSNVRYDLSFTLTPRASTLAGEVQIRFSLRRTSPLLLDFRQGRVGSVQINGASSPVVVENGHLELFPASLKRGENEVRIQFTAPVASAGAAITRFEDRDDNSEYIYTLFVPMDASMAFPCFDQPDLKARFKLAVTAPAAWTVVSNGPVESAVEADPDQRRTVFAETQPISTYLFAFAAGPFRKLQGAPGLPAIYARAAAVERARPEVARFEQITSQGMRYFADYFAQPFPFAKYDTVLIPGLAYSGMEHAGATFLREESVLFRTAPTQSDRLRRDILVLHELAHQWFGDLVTMRWFDDLWLKEGFAQYMAFHALDSFEPGEHVWKRFYESIKPAAYAIDATQGATPIYQDIPNLQDAKSAYGAIVYSKAPGVLRQLVYVLGEEMFRDGLRLYLKEHAYGNAEWNDLVRALERVSRHSLKTWADVWIRRRGMPQVDVAWSCEGSQLSRLTLSQRGVLDGGDLWPLVMQLVLDYGNRQPVRLRVGLNGRRMNVGLAAGQPCPRFVFANGEDFAYGRFLLDERSREEVMSRIAAMPDLFQRTLLWGSLWESVREAQLAPRQFIELAAKSLPGETDESLARSLLARVTTALHRYVSDETRRQLAPSFETLAAEQMLKSPDPDLRVAWFRALQGLSETPAGLAQLKDLLSERLAIPGIELRSLDRWNLVTALVAMYDPDAPSFLSAERERDPSGDGLKYAYAAEAARPDPETKAKFFAEYLRTDSHPEDWIEQSLFPFNYWNQSELTAIYLKQALDALPQIKTDRKIFFLENWLDAFIQGQQSLDARNQVHRHLDDARIDRDLRLKILETVDELDRTVTIRHQFPD